MRRLMGAGACTGARGGSAGARALLGGTSSCRAAGRQCDDARRLSSKLWTGARMEDAAARSRSASDSASTPPGGRGLVACARPLSSGAGPSESPSASEMTTVLELASPSCSWCEVLTSLALDACPPLLPSESVRCSLCAGLRTSVGNSCVDGLIMANSAIVACSGRTTIVSSQRWTAAGPARRWPGVEPPSTSAIVYRTWRRRLPSTAANRCTPE
mmetsp:Transcript_24959/g.64401  ORF Transcript_24959/g.64401 Transcript_24959/m.64401 type:complete len:215 (-) Transcript_24959:591-1235(-)